MRLISAAAFPILPKNWFIQKDGGFSKLSNSLRHGEVSIKDMAFLTRYYQIHLLKTMVAGLLFNGVAQFALSFVDDDERDEHGEVGDGQFFAKKRFPQFNEKRHRSQIRIPITDMRGRRRYWSPQIFREAQHIQQLLGDWGSRNVPDQMANWFRNRLSLATVPAFLLFNRDYFGKEIRNSDLSLRLQTEQVWQFMKEQGTPLGFRKEERVTTGDPVVDVPLFVAELFGLNQRLGVPTDPFTTVEQINKLTSEAAISEFIRDQDFSLIDEATLRQLALKNPRLFKEKVRAELLRRRFPGRVQARKLASQAAIGRLYQGREMEVRKELDKLLKQ
jgi:hypothetical protein